MTRIAELERALRACVMEPGAASRQNGLRVLGLDAYGNPVDSEPLRCVECGDMIMQGARCELCRRVEYRSYGSE